MIIEVGNIAYIIEVLIAFSVVLLSYFILKNKSKRFQNNYLLIWLFVGFALHFIKQLVYRDFGQLHKSTAENICAVSTLVFPFIMLIKRKSVLHDYMFLIGIVGGLAGVLYPTEALGKSMFEFETIRFYFCHMSLFAVSLLLALLDLRRPDIKKWWLIPLCFLGYQVIILLNTALLTFTGMVTKDGYTALELFLSRKYLNNSFTFGPTDDMGAVGEFIGNLTFSFMKKDIFNLNNGDVFYWPVIWLLVPSYVLFVPFYLIFTIPFTIRNRRKDKRVLVLVEEAN